MQIGSCNIGCSNQYERNAILVGHMALFLFFDFSTPWLLQQGTCSICSKCSFYRNNMVYTLKKERKKERKIFFFSTVVYHSWIRNTLMVFVTLEWGHTTMKSPYYYNSIGTKASGGDLSPYMKVLGGHLSTPHCWNPANQCKYCIPMGSIPMNKIIFIEIGHLLNIAR